MAKLLSIEVDKIYIYPLGGISKFIMPFNISIKKEFLILIMGPLFQVLASEILLLILEEYKEMILIYHYGILFFNLLPIYPLDGGKLVNLLFCTKLSFKTSFFLSIYISYFTIILLFFINYHRLDLNVVFVILFLLFKVSREQKRFNFIYQKFLLERYLNNYNFKKSKLINSPNKFHRNRRHLLKVGQEYYLEKDYLNKIYNN